MSVNKWMQQLQKMEGAVVDDYDPYAHVISSPSPSVNFIFGNSWGLPLGYTAVLYGPPKGGKSVLTNAMIGQLHRDYPEAIAIKFNTEFRERAQLTPQQSQVWGIDRKRYIAFDVNSPKLIFDRIEQEVAAMCEAGAQIKMIVIDSVNSIQGRRAMNAESIDVQQIGDHALTIQDGLKRILPTQRKYNIGLVLIAQARAEMDMIEQKRGNRVKMAASFGLQHYAEYFIFVEPNKNKEGRTDLLGHEFRNEDLGDIKGDGEKFAHKIRVTMKDSSLGPKGRVGEFTLDYNAGIVNVHEEIFLLGTNRGVIARPNQTSYAFGDKKWVGKPAMIQALADSSELREQVLSELKRQDKAGNFSAQDAQDAKNSEESPE